MGEPFTDAELQRMTDRKTVALSVSFRKWSRRHPWECRRCGAAVVDPKAHARWHAHVEAGARLSLNPGEWSEGWPSTKHMDVTVSMDGWDL